jgi:hypothetical protein
VQHWHLQSDTMSMSSSAVTIWSYRSHCFRFILPFISEKSLCLPVLGTSPLLSEKAKKFEKVHQHEALWEVASNFIQIRLYLVIS